MHYAPWQPMQNCCAYPTMQNYGAFQVKLIYVWIPKSFIVQIKT